MVRRASHPLGADLHDSVETAIQQSSVFVLLASEDALCSSWVQKEVNLARGRITIVTVLTGEVRESDLPVDLATRVLLTSELSDHQVARSLSDLHTSPATCPCSGLNRQVWLRIDRDGAFEHHLDAVDGAGATVGSVHLVTPDFRNLGDELRAAANPDLSWLPDDHLASVWRSHVREMPIRHDRIMSLIPETCGRYLATGRGDDFHRAAVAEATAYLVRRLHTDLCLLHHFDRPSELSVDEVQDLMEQPPQPFPGGLRAHLSAGSFEMPLSCPSYVEEIDLPPMMVPGESAVLAMDLGRMVGYAAASLTWTRARESRLREPLPLAEPAPDLKDVQIGLA